MIENDTAGTKISDFYQYEFRNWVMGAETKTRIEHMEGLRGMPEVRRESLTLPGRHGEVPSRAYYEPRKISWDMWLQDSADQIDKLMDQLGDVFILPETSVEEPFVMLRPNMGGRRRVYAKINRFDIDTDYNYAHGLGTASIELLASDPFWYGNQLRHEQAVINNGDGAEGVTIRNYGKVRSERIFLVITGPSAEGAVIQCVTDANRQIKLLNALGVGEVLVIDVAGRSATWYPDQNAYEADDGGESSYNFTRLDNQWWSLPPGNTTINFDRGGTSATSILDIYWRDAWMI